MFTRYSTSILIILLGMIVSDVCAQLAMPIRYDNSWWECWSIRERDVDMTVRDQVASVTVTDNVSNTCSHVTEVQYVFPLPQDAAVDQFTLVVDGRELTGRMLDANEARDIYNEIVRRRRDPGLLEYAGYGFFRSSAFPLEPGHTAKLIVHYTATCKKDGDVVELWYPMSSGKFYSEPVGHFKLTADIESTVDISHVYSPSLDLDIDRKSPDRVVASYEAHHYRPLSDFQLFYETSCEEVGATLLTYWPDRNKDGYYMMMVSPNSRNESENIQSKNIVVVMDHSGSMSGEKIKQAREAVRFIFNNLNHGDYFNFVAYNDNVDCCFNSLKSASSEIIDRAIRRLDRTEADGGTNIYVALNIALSQFNSLSSDHHGPCYIVFLTDGLPTVGITGESEILDNTRMMNQSNVRIFSFGVGYDVNVRLLDNLVYQNHGRSAYVKPKESIEAKVSSLYKRIKNPFMTSLQVSLLNFGTRDNCPSELGDLFEGDQLFRVGRIYPLNDGDLYEPGSEDCPTTLTVSGTLNGNSRNFEYPVKLNLEEPSSPFRFIEKLWAARRIGQLLEQIQLHGRAEEMVDELIRLSKKYGIVTPYTSFLADERPVAYSQKESREKALPVLSQSAESITGPQAQADAFTRAQASDISQLTKLKSQSGHAMRMGAANQAEYESGVTEEIKTIRIVGNITLYKRGDVWLTSDVMDLDLIRDRNSFTVIQRYSDEYFALIAKNSLEENQVLAAQQPNEKLAIKLRGIAYIVE